MLVEIHMIQNHSPSNLNRDDLGAPKSCTFGGVTRARISSQCLKRSIRNPGNSNDVHNKGASLFVEAMREHTGIRTKYFPEMVRQALNDSSVPDEEWDRVVQACTSIAKKEVQIGDEDVQEPGDSDERHKLPQLVLLERTEANAFVHVLEAMRTSDEWSASYRQWIAGKLQKRPLAAFLRELSRAYSRRSVDIAMFGRMTTSDAFEDVEAAMQVAHAISTHQAVSDVDYFTAVDDLGELGGGAGHVDEAMFNSACFYKYFALDWDQLISNLGGSSSSALAASALGHFIRAAAMTTPTGKQNSFAAHNLPDGILVEVKRTGKIPVNYANAFVEPVAMNAPRGVVGMSIAQLGQYVHQIAEGYGIDSRRFWFSPGGRYQLTWIERCQKGEPTEREVVAGEDSHARFDDFVSVVVQEVSGLEWNRVKDPDGFLPEAT